MDTKETVKTLLIKQMRLLSQESKKAPSRLEELTDSMVKIVQQLTMSGLI